MNQSPDLEGARKLHCLNISVANFALWRNPYLSAFLPDHNIQVALPFIRQAQGKMLGWGYKQSGLNASEVGKKLGQGSLLLEDGFLRSVGLGVEGYPPHSLITDSSGIYYDSTKPSDLECLIVQSENLSAEQIVRSSRAIKSLIAQRLSKYNHAPDWALFPSKADYRVLVVDQTYGDASVNYGGATDNTFLQMLESALAEHPDSEVLVKVHPDVLAGKKRGYLFEHARDLPCTLIAEDINPWSLLDEVQQVYVVTSQFGFEALMAGKKVSCFGVPFYAGWGLTDDRKICPRRGLKRSLEQIFYAAYIQYSLYINPYTRQRCEVEDTVCLISQQKNHRDKFSGEWLALGFSSWKKGFVKDYLGEGASVRFEESYSHINPDYKNLKVLAWSSRISDEVESYFAEAEVNLYRMEDGFIRSVGLGVDLVRPLSLVVDSCGIYYDSTKPSDLENYLNTHSFPPELLSRAAKVRKKLVELRLSKYNVGHTDPLAFPNSKRIILVPGQVETDASIAKGSPRIRSNTELLRTVREQNPDAYLIYKPHPDVLSGGRLGELEKASEQYFDLLVTDIAITELFEQVDEVHTMSSLAGFEALLRGLKVNTYGMPFYAGWGLTTDLLSCERRQRTLTLDQLVAATLILYPIYVDPDTGHICDVETVIALLYKNRDKVNGPSLKTRIYRIYRNLFEGKR